MCLVGTKCDLEGKRSVSVKDVQTFAAAKNVYTIETSAKTNKNVERCFIDCASMLFKRLAWPNHVPQEKTFRAKVGIEESDWIVRNENEIRQQQQKCSIM